MMEAASSVMMTSSVFFWTRAMVLLEDLLLLIPITLRQRGSLEIMRVHSRDGWLRHL
jgi:hypothetical protein